MMRFAPVSQKTTKRTPMLRTNRVLSAHGVVSICAGTSDASTNKPECTESVERAMT